MNIQPLDLFAEARALAGTNPQHALMIRVASARLHRFHGRADRVADLAAFALAAVGREKERARLFAQDMERVLMSSEASARRAQRLLDAAALDVPGETEEARRARMFAAYEQDSAVALPVHRAGSALWVALERKEVTRPHSARDDELFAALGLVLLVRGMSWRPAIGGRDGVRSLLDGGEEALRGFAADGRQATENLLDAAECIYGWQHLKPKPELQAPWKQAFVKMLPAFAVPGGGFISAKEAAKAFSEAHPEFRAHADIVARGKAFEVDYSRLQKYHEH